MGIPTCQSHFFCYADTVDKQGSMRLISMVLSNVREEERPWISSGSSCGSRCLACRACSLAQERTQVVFGVGDPAAEVLLVGEAPGANEDKQGEPFVGRAGKLLDDMLQMIGLSRERIYITNSVKCRPPQNRDPLNTEKEACSGYLRRQMELMQPKILVCLGRISAMELIKPDFRITQEHGQFFRQDGIEKMAMYHPAALLRNPGKKPETFEDLKRLQAKIREICVRTKLDF